MKLPFNAWVFYEYNLELKKYVISCILNQETYRGKDVKVAFQSIYDVSCQTPHTTKRWNYQAGEEIDLEKLVS